MKENKNQNFLRLGNKNLYIHGAFLRYKNDDSENIEILITKIVSISIEKLEGQYKNLIWAMLGFILFVISWYFLENTLLSNILCVLSLLGGTVYLLSYFIFSNYLKLIIKTSRLDLYLEFPSQKKYSVNKFKNLLLEKLHRT